MPSPLTFAHRQAQLVVRAAMLRDLLRMWPALNPERVDATFDAWAGPVTTLINARYATSAGLAVAYLQRIRAQKLGVSGQTFTPDALPAEQVATSLLVTGPVAIKRLTAGGATPAAAAAVAFVLHSGSASRLALAGGRQTIQANIRADSRATGYERVTGGGCDFCELLASQTWPSDSADFPAHDHCACTLEPLYE